MTDACYEKINIAICFWGITRSLKYTIDSIRKYIFNQLTDYGISYDIYLHTYEVIGEYNNIRAGERGIVLDNDEYHLLNADHMLIQNQHEVDDIINLSKYRSQPIPAPWHNNETTFNNHLRALWSLNEVTKLWLPHSSKYTHILYCRPDVLFIEPIKLGYFRNEFIKANVILTPDFHLTHDMNDRFAIGNSNVMKIYGTRWEGAYEYSLTNSLHSEIYLAHVLKSNRIPWKKISYRFRRIRANGKVNDIDRDL